MDTSTSTSHVLSDGPACHRNDAHRPALSFLARRYVELITAVTFLFTLQAGLVPFDFAPADEGGRAFLCIVVDHLIFPDIVSNILLYLPFGFFLHWCVSVRVGRLPGWLLAVLIGAAVSFSVESVQSFSASRVSSVIDLISNVVGMALGATVSWMWRCLVPGMLRAARDEVLSQPAVLSVKIYCLLLAVMAAVPFTVSFDANRFKQSVRAATWMPFGETAPDPSFPPSWDRSNPDLVTDWQNWCYLKRWSRWGAEGASFAMLGWLLHSMLRDFFGFKALSCAVLTIWLGGSLALTLSLIQLFIISRACDVTDVLFRWAGLLMGFALCCARVAGMGVTSPQKAHVPVRAAAFAAAAYILFTGLCPFTFRASLPGVRDELFSTSFLPFFAYFETRFDLMISDVIEKFGAYTILASLLSARWMRTGAPGLRARLIPVAMICVAIAAFIECSQLLLAVRVASLTEPFLAIAGAFVGVMGQEWLLAVRRMVEAARDAKAPPDVEATPALSLTDRLVAELTEPHPDAPREPSEFPARVDAEQRDSVPPASGRAG